VLLVRTVCGRPRRTDPGVTVATQEEGTGVHTNAVTEAPTGFNFTTNGFVAQTDMDAARAGFETAETFADGIGPVFNNISCVSCHGNPFFANGGSQITELRAGHFNGISFVDHPGGSLINDRANDRSIQEHILSGNEVRRSVTLATSDGFVGVDRQQHARGDLQQPAGRSA
jgi:hypothetical protein